MYSLSESCYAGFNFFYFFLTDSVCMRVLMLEVFTSQHSLFDVLVQMWTFLTEMQNKEGEGASMQCKFNSDNLSIEASTRTLGELLSSG